MTLADVMAIYRGSDGDATRALYVELHDRGPAGFVAVNLFRAAKCSERAKVYRGGGYRRDAYGRKEWSIGNLCTVLEGYAVLLGIRWGWLEDPAQSFHRWVLYIDLPDVGQVSFHVAQRGRGPDFPCQWDGVRGAAPQRVCRYAASVLELPPPSVTVEARGLAAAGVGSSE
jgi:hypothetical protein